MSKTPRTEEGIHNHLFIETRGDGVWLVCVEKIHKSQDEAAAACKKWKAAHLMSDAFATERPCQGCGKLLVLENAWMNDGCSCNTTAGVNNHNLYRWKLLHDLQQQQSRKLTAAKEKIAEQEAPIPMLLFCPRCEHQHIDAPEPEVGWTNPPHATHTCMRCGLSWRPSNHLTTGVAEIECLEPKHAERIAAARPSAEAQIKALEKELAWHRSFKASVDEALNSGDGSYRP